MMNPRFSTSSAKATNTKANNQVKVKAVTRGCQDATWPPPNRTTNRKTSVQLTIPRIIPAPHSFFVDLEGCRPISLKGRLIKHFQAMIGISIIRTSVRSCIVTGRQASLTQLARGEK